MSESTATCMNVRHGGARALWQPSGRGPLPRTWWLPGAGAGVGAMGAMVFAGPVVLDPLFNRFEPLDDGPLRRDVLELAQRAGVRVREVYVVDAGRRTTAANAYVTGLGATKRVVLFDTLIEHFTPEERSEERRVGKECRSRWEA